MLHDHIKFHSDQMKSAGENEAKVSESGVEWQSSMVPISRPGMKKCR